MCAARKLITALKAGTPECGDQDARQIASSRFAPNAQAKAAKRPKFPSGPIETMPAAADEPLRILGWECFAAFAIGGLDGYPAGFGKL